MNAEPVKRVQTPRGVFAARGQRPSRAKRRVKPWGWGPTALNKDGARLLMLLALCALPSLASAQSLVYVVRHAERADGGAGASTMSGAPADPHLSAAGVARAAKLAEMLGDAGIKAIYATEFKRTQETAAPLALKLHVAVDTITSADSAALLASMKAHHPHDVVVVVAHSNTMPAIIKALGGPEVTIADDEYGTIFVVVPGTGVMSRIRF